MSLGDGIASLLQEAAFNRELDNRDREALRNSIEWEAAYTRISNERDTFRRELCGMLGIAGAIGGCLSRDHYGHPLIRDAKLRKAVFDAGVAAGRTIPLSYETIFRVGEQFPLPAEALAMGQKIPRLERRAAESEGKAERAENDHMIEKRKRVETEYENTQLRARIAALEGDLIATQSREAALRDSDNEKQTVLDRIEADLVGHFQDFAAHMALHYAYRTALKESSPDHALVQDPRIRSRVIEQAQAHVRASTGETLDWQSIRAIGEGSAKD